MISIRTLTPVCLLAGALGMAQTAPPAPTGPSQPSAVAPAPAPARSRGMRMLPAAADDLDFAGLAQTAPPASPRPAAAPALAPAAAVDLDFAEVAQTAPPASPRPVAALALAPAAAVDLDFAEVAQTAPPASPRPAAAPVLAPAAAVDLDFAEVAQTAPPASPRPVAAPALAPAAAVDLDFAEVAQTAPPAPPASPQPPAAAPAPAPAPAPPSPGMHMLLGPADGFDFSGLSDQIQEQMSKIDLGAVQEQLQNLKIDLSDMDFSDIGQEASERAREAMERAREQMQRMGQGIGRGFGQGIGQGFAFAQQTPIAPMPPMPPMPAMPSTRPLIIRGRGSVDGLYERGLSALDSHRYDQALECFTEVASRGANHAEGALYWKAYALNKLGRRDDATAALADLRKTYPNSHWLQDAQALEIEVKQSSGQKVSPESESNDELKLLALEGLVQSDPDRAFPILERLLKGPQTPNLKKRAIYVLALSNSTRAQQLLEQIAKGGTGNPDLQITAIQYLGRTGKDANKPQVLFDIYNTSTDVNVKHEAMRAMLSNRDKDHLMQIAKSDKSPDMRQEAIRDLAGLATAQEMWTLYQAETDLNVKRTILDYMSGSTDRLMEVARTEKDPSLRRSAIQRLGSVKSANSGDVLVQIYGTEQDPQVKRAIIDTLAGAHNVKALVDIGRKETDLEMKKNIVRRLVDMRSPEATQFLEEILK